MAEINIEHDSHLVAKQESGNLEINGNSNVLKIQRNSGIIKINGNETCIYLGGELDQNIQMHMSGNDLIYQITEVVELLIILLIFYVIFNSINY